MVCPVCPLGPHRSRKHEMWVVWTFSGRPIYSHLALGGRVMHREGREWSKKIGKKIGKANGMPSLPIWQTQVTKTGNVGSVDAPRTPQLFTFGPRGQGISLRGS